MALHAQRSFPPRDVDALVRSLADIVGDRLTRAASELEQHGRGETHFPPMPPDVVVYPERTEEVSAIVRLCAERDVPVIPYGAGSSLEGHVSAPFGGVSLDLTRMSRILRTSVEDLDVTVEAGVTRKQLVRALGATGATFYVDPGADATIGGMLATGASGTTTVRYGAMRENTLGMTVVLADGSVIRTGSRARKSSAGYDLTRLFIGSEGTLGVITEATLRLHPVPDAIAAAACAFATVDAAVDAVVALLQSGVPLARIELLDDVTIAALNDHLALGYPVSPMVFLELHAFSRQALDEQLAAVHEVVEGFGGAVHASATTEEARARLWDARHRVYYAGLAQRPGARSWTTDVCVPVSHLAECIRETRADVVASGIVAPLVGHVGDGNFHLLLLIDPGHAGERDAAHRAGARPRRHVHRGTRHRAREGGVAAQGARRRAPRDAGDQGGARPTGNPQSREDLRVGRQSGIVARIRRSSRSTRVPSAPSTVATTAVILRRCPPYDRFASSRNGAGRVRVHHLECITSGRWAWMSWRWGS